MSDVLRPADDSDWDAIRSVADEAVPWAPDSNAIWSEARRAFDARRYARRQYVADDDGGAVVGYAAVEGSDVPGRFRLFVVTRPDRLSGGLGEMMYCRLLVDLDELGATAAWMREDARDGLVAFAEARGFRQIARFHWADAPDGPMDVVSLELTRRLDGFSASPNAASGAPPA